METLEQLEKKGGVGSIKEKIESAESFEDLENILRESDGISGSEEREFILDGKLVRDKRRYDAGEIIEKIRMVREGNIVLRDITREGGLREKVGRLLIKDAEDLNDLKSKLMQIGGSLKFGSEHGKLGEETKEADGSYWAGMVDKVEKGLGPGYLTRELGLRAKAMELMK